MISCDTAKRMLSDYIENNLPPDQRQSVDAHLSSCHECKHVFDDVIFLTEKLRQLPPVSTSDEFDSQLRFRISGDYQEGSSSPFSKRHLTFGLSGAALIAMLTFFILTTINTPSENFTEPINPGRGISQPQQQMASPILAQPSISNTTVQNFRQEKDSVNQNPATLNQNQLKLVDQEKH